MKRKDTIRKASLGDSEAIRELLSTYGEARLFVPDDRGGIDVDLTAEVLDLYDRVNITLTSVGDPPRTPKALSEFTQANLAANPYTGEPMVGSAWADVPERVRQVVIYGVRMGGQLSGYTEGQLIDLLRQGELTSTTDYRAAKTAMTLEDWDNTKRLLKVMVKDRPPASKTSSRPRQRKLTQDQRMKLRTFLRDGFSLGDLKTISFDMGFDPEDNAGSGKSGFARKLISIADNRVRGHELARRAKDRNPGLWYATGMDTAF